MKIDPIPGKATNTSREELAKTVAALEFPEKFSDFLDAALDDLKRCSKAPQYVVDMRKWHEPEAETGLCRICLAGAYLTRVLMPEESDYTSGEVLEPLDAAIFALDSARRGEWAGVILRWREHRQRHKIPEPREVPEFEMTWAKRDDEMIHKLKELPRNLNPVTSGEVQQFIADLREAAKILREYGC